MKSTTLHPMEVAKRVGIGGGSSPELESRVSLLEEKVAGLEEYSTDEVDTGKEWIDGKRIYRKVMVGRTATTRDTESEIGSVENLDSVINVYGSLGNGIPVNSNNGSDYARTFMRHSTGVAVVTTSLGFTNADITAVFEYTKNE